jgi:hypothetical protein
MQEVDVQAAFVGHLRDRGWDVTTENADYTDVVARRGTEWIVAEVKGKTSSPGLDVDTAYGQLLRRMNNRPPGTRYAVVLPASLAEAAARVGDDVRVALQIDIWLVHEDGAATILMPVPNVS